MALHACRECGKEVSSQATTCPYCGITKPVRRPSRLVTDLTGIVVMSVFGFGVITYCSSDRQKEVKQNTVSATIAPEPPKQTPEEKRRADLSPLSAEDLRVVLSSEYQATIEALYPRLNHITTRIKKSGKGYYLYAVHDFFSQYTLSAGGQAKIISAWINSNDEWLRKAKINRVGVWGTGDYSSGAWYDIQR